MKVYKPIIEVFLPQREMDSLYINLKLWQNKSFDDFAAAMAFLAKVESVIGPVFGDFYNTFQRHGDGSTLYIRELVSIYCTEPFARLTITEHEYDGSGIH